MKIIDKILEANGKGQTVFSYEFFPPRTEEGVDNLFERLERMAAYGPVFCDITWGAGGSTADVTLDIAKRMQNQICVETMMHLTCTNMQVEKLENALAEVRKAGLQNILALRGDPPKGQEKFEVIEGGFSCALDLVKYIRQTHGDYFGICVAGYPEAHPDTIVEDHEQMEKNYWANLDYLKQKIEAGGEMIITQLFYDVDLFLKFVKDCRSIGIDVPIVPGIMPIMTYGGFKRMTGFCKTKVPQDILDAVEANKDNEEAIKNYGIELGTQMCRRLLDAGVPGLHMYSLNLEKSVLAILERLGILSQTQVPRRMPWALTPVGTSRASEAVRPIFWQHRPRSYLHRTQEWDAYPTGRWGDIRSPGYGSLDAHPFMQRHTSNAARKARAVEMWGPALNSVADVQRVFERFFQGEISLLPWSEMEFKPAPAANSPLRQKLAQLATKGLLAINAQECVNGAPSTDLAHGWGGKGGYVYQKAYVEFFASPEAFQQLLPKLQAASSLSYLATTAQGEVASNMEEGAVNAVTWGCFPGKEVVQPHVVDPESFSVWKQEAFGLWSTEWGNCYEEGSASRTLLQQIASTWHLVSVVDNDYVAGDLFKVFA